MYPPSHIYGMPRNVDSSQTQTYKPPLLLLYIHLYCLFYGNGVFVQRDNCKPKLYSVREKFDCKACVQWTAGTPLFHSGEIRADQKCSESDHKADWHNTATQALWEVLRGLTAAPTCRYFGVISTPRKNIPTSNICFALSNFFMDE